MPGSNRRIWKGRNRFLLPWKESAQFDHTWPTVWQYVQELRDKNGWVDTRCKTYCVRAKNKIREQHERS